MYVAIGSYRGCVIMPSRFLPGKKGNKKPHYGPHLCIYAEYTTVIWVRQSVSAPGKAETQDQVHIGRSQGFSPLTFLYLPPPPPPVYPLALTVTIVTREITSP